VALHAPAGDFLVVGLVVIGLVVAGLIAIIALIAMLARSSDQTCERVFRLLRWIRNCPEPGQASRAGRDTARPGGAGPQKATAR
jgi:phosphatidylglycerophosphate synthase